MPEVRRLIVNADDMALHPAVNRAIATCHREGIVTSATVLACGSAFDDALAVLKDCPDLGVGIHLCLVDQKPVCPLDQVPSLVDNRGSLCASYTGFVRRLALRRIRLDEVRRELEAQIRRLLDAGMRITHLDSHQHLHLLPGIADIVAELGKKAGIRGVRIPAEVVLPGAAAPSAARRLQRRLVFRLASARRRAFLDAGFVCPDHFVGFSRGGWMRADDWLRLIPQLPAGDTEVMVHPGSDDGALHAQTGWGYHWQEEMAALTNPEIRRELESAGVRLIHYGDLR